jgi:GDPmannose 4,6-dehydratase
MSFQAAQRKKTALIFGVSGQDGGYLARLLLDKGYEVHGTSRDCASNPFIGLHRLGIADRVKLHTVALTEFRSVISVMHKVTPDEIYDLAGQTSVALSFELPVEAFESITVGTINILECVRLLGRPIKSFHAASSECFGETEIPADERTPFRPRSPYAMAKAAAFWAVANYREAYGMSACSGIMFNHESPLRPERFVTQKIVKGALDIAAGKLDKLRLGNLAVERDWGWAPEYVDAAWRMLQAPTPTDLIIATGQTHSLLAMVEEAFALVGLDWRERVETSESLIRRTDLSRSAGDPARIQEVTGWKAETCFHDVIREMMAAKRAEMATSGDRVAS